MSYISARREEEKERRRAEIVDAAERLYATRGWDAVTVDQVARSARLSRALVYVYFKDKEDLLFGIGERAMRTLHERFVAALALPGSGREKIEGIGRAYMGYAHEFPHYFDFCSRFQSHAANADPGTNEGGCQIAGDQAIGTVVKAIEMGIADGSIRADIGDPLLLALTLWAFTHGIIQLATVKASELARRGIAIPEFAEYAFELLRAMMRSAVPG
jgi:AcrR family transcriptional regulator